MPFYEYECPSCRYYLEVLQKISDRPLRKCPSCGKSAFKRLVSAPVFRLKGSGWYETDFKSDKDSKRNLAGAEREEAGDKSGDKAGDKAKGEESKAGAPEGAKAVETKPAAKPEAGATADKPAARSGTTATAARTGKRSSASRAAPRPARPRARSAPRRKGRR